MELQQPGFRHEALLYAGEDEFVERLGAFVREGVEANEPVLVVVGAHKLERLREHLGATGDSVLYADMAGVGANPACIIPAWREFVSTYRGRRARMRGIGEPIYPERSSDELVECQRHESLLNLAFEDVPGFWLVCPYDTEALPAEVIEEARRSHPHVDAAEGVDYRGSEAIAAPFDLPLPDSPYEPEEIAFDESSLGAVRKLVRSQSTSAGFDPAAVDDLVLAVNEIATNSVRHGGGHGAVSIWAVDGRLVCEIRDAGRLLDPLAGRVRPEAGANGGHGLWLANQLCDLLQIRSFRHGTTVRLHRRRP